jgi:hypothetical protein
MTRQCLVSISPSTVSRKTFGSPKVVATCRPAPAIVKSSTVHESSCPAGPNLITPRLCEDIRSSFLRSVVGKTDPIQRVFKRSLQFRSRAQQSQVYPATCMSVCACRSSRQKYFAACCARPDAASRQHEPCPFGTLGKSLRYRQHQ